MIKLGSRLQADKEQQVVSDPWLSIRQDGAALTMDSSIEESKTN